MELLIAASILNEINLRKAEVIRETKNMANRKRKTRKFDRLEWKMGWPSDAVTIARTFRLHNTTPTTFKLFVRAKYLINSLGGQTLRRT